MTEYLVVSENLAHALPDRISDEEGALMEPLSVGLWACQRADIAANDEVLVMGAGPIGLLACQVARERGASVTVVDVDRDRLLLATELGADRIIDARGSDLAKAAPEADALIECSGVERALENGLAALRRRGRAVIVGMSPTGRATVPMDLLQKHELTLSGSYRYAGTYPDAIRLTAEKRIQLQPMITGRFSLGEAETALRLALRPERGVKSLIVTAAAET
jgi:L-iditol 2-dehydrogenase